MRTGVPDLPSGVVITIGGELDVDEPASDQTLIRTLRSLHHGSVGYQPRANAIDLAKKAYPCKRIENTSKNTEDTISQTEE